MESNRNFSLMAKAKWRLIWLGIAIYILAIQASAQQAQTITIPDDTGNLVHFSYATLLGTGVYRLDDRTVTIFRMPLGWTVREATPEKYGINIDLPVAIGLHDFDILEDLIPVGDQLSTISAVPGLELEFLIKDRWRLKPAVYSGVGYDMSNNEASFIYGAGISALYAIPTDYPEMNFGTAMIMTGYIPSDGESDFITRWSVGVDSKFMTPLEFGDGNIFIGGHVIGYAYLNKVQFQTIINEPIEISKEIEIGIFFGARPTPKIFGIEIDRLGAGYRFSSQGDAIVFFAGFPF
jgi:hypothetical protein